MSSRISVRLLCASVMCAVTLAACARDAQGVRTIASPANAIALAPLGENRLAVLTAGTETRAVSIVNAEDGKVISSFGVTKNATAIAAGSEAGPLYVGVGSDDGNRSVGAVEFYSLTGVKNRVVPLPGAARSVTMPIDGTLYALAAIGARVRSAVPIRASDGAIGTAVPVDGGIATISACTVDGRAYLVTSGAPDAPTSAVDIRSHGIRRSRAVGTAAACSGAGRAVYTVEKAGGSASLAVLEAPRLLPEGLVDAPADTIALVPRGPDVVTLGTSDGHSTISIFSAAALKGGRRVGAP